jgi:hypothetical protein
MTFSAVDSVITEQYFLYLRTIYVTWGRRIRFGWEHEARTSQEKWVLPKTRTLMYRMQDYGWRGCNFSG